jgi:hypothetical protein
MTDTKRIAALVEAYHTIYDIKDEAEPGQREGLWYACYEAANHVAGLIERIGGKPPRRFDGNGRPADSFTAAKSRYSDACRDVEREALIELRRITLDLFPTATDLLVDGRYSDDGDFRIGLVAVALADGTQVEGDDLDDLDDSITHLTDWLETVKANEYEGYAPIVFNEIPA